MMQRLKNAFAAGEDVTGADANFYLHEAAEATMMNSNPGMDPLAAHEAVIAKYGVSRFSLYHPAVVDSNAGSFNPNWRNYWNLPKKP